MSDKYLEAKLVSNKLPRRSLILAYLDHGICDPSPAVAAVLEAYAEGTLSRIDRPMFVICDECGGNGTDGGEGECFNCGRNEFVGLVQVRPVREGEPT